MRLTQFCNRDTLSISLLLEHKKYETKKYETADIFNYFKTAIYRKYFCNNLNEKVIRFDVLDYMLKNFLVTRNRILTTRIKLQLN